MLELKGFVREGAGTAPEIVRKDIAYSIVDWLRIWP